MSKNEFYFFDYPDLVKQKKITEEGMKRVRELDKMLKEIKQKYNIKLI
jgi:hypothetical protein